MIRKRPGKPQFSTTAAIDVCKSKMKKGTANHELRTRIVMSDHRYSIRKRTANHELSTRTGVSYRESSMKKAQPTTR